MGMNCLDMHKLVEFRATELRHYYSTLYSTIPNSLPMLGFVTLHFTHGQYLTTLGTILSQIRHAAEQC